MLFCWVVFVILWGNFPCNAQQSAESAGIGKVDKKKIRLKKLIDNIATIPNPPFFKPQSYSPAHNRKGPAVLSCGMDKTLVKYQATHAESRPGYIEALKETQAIVYQVNLTCESKMDMCVIVDYPLKESSGALMSINMVRSYFYRWWLKMYDNDALIMLSDFRDVIFQSNPFLYVPKSWAPPRYQLAVFLEHFPSKMIYRCPFTSRWISDCYGKEALNEIQYNKISCSGTVMGSRDGMLAYVSIVPAVYGCIMAP